MKIGLTHYLFMHGKVTFQPVAGHFNKLLASALAFGLTLGLCAATARSDARTGCKTSSDDSHDDGPSNGTRDRYDIEIAGVYSGHGSAVGDTATVTIDAPVKDAAGNVGAFHATLTIANGHFTGTGTAMGQPITLNGRLDFADPSSTGVRVIKSAHLAGTFTTGTGLHGRVAGQWNSHCSTGS